MSFRTGTRGRSAAYVRYIARAAATEERSTGRTPERASGSGFLTRNLPDEIHSVDRLSEARTLLASFAKVREEEETRGRTHFRVSISFERPVPNELALSMVAEWLRGSFPDARAAAFLHHDTKRLHAHVWIDSRLVGGRKISLSPSENRAFCERWNHIYCRELGLDERDYLRKVEETREFRRSMARGDGRGTEEPRRVHTDRWRSGPEGREDEREDRDGR